MKLQCQYQPKIRLASDYSVLVPISLQYYVCSSKAAISGDDFSKRHLISIKDFLEPRIISSRGPSDFYTKTPVIVAFPKILLFKIKNQPRCVGRLIYVHPKSPKRKKNCKPSVKCIVFKILWICIAINYESSSYVSETE